MQSRIKPSMIKQGVPEFLMINHKNHRTEELCSLSGLRHSGWAVSQASYLLDLLSCESPGGRWVQHFPNLFQCGTLCLGPGNTTRFVGSSRGVCSPCGLLSSPVRTQLPRPRACPSVIQCEIKCGNDRFPLLQPNSKVPVGTGGRRRRNNERDHMAWLWRR